MSDEQSVPPRPAALPKRERIASRRDFLRIYGEGRKLFSKYCVLFVSSTSNDFPRIGITTTRRIGKAHDRNRLRRWIREIYRLNRDQIGLNQQSIDIVINVKPGATLTTFALFSGDLIQVFRKALKENRS